MPYINESLVIMSHGKLIALIYPDLNAALANGYNERQLMSILDKSRTDLNKELPAYAQITKIVFRNEEFEKTAKKSIKRYLYQE